MSVKLNVGCGDWPQKGWVNIDIHDGNGQEWMPDIVASVLAMPFENGMFEQVYMGHVMEHLPIEEIAPAMLEVFRVCKPKAKICIVGPDIEKTAVMEPAAMHVNLHGGNRWSGDEHRWHSTTARMVRHLSNAGVAVQEVPLQQVADDGWPIVSTIAWQFALYVVAP